MITERYEYFAFISYKREDEKWARWLQNKLESYSLPIALRKDNPDLPVRIRPVFRDQSDLSGGNLKAEIEKGLDSSKYLIVICSPRSAASPWVSKEVRHFIDRGRDEYIIPFIIDGIPNSANPQDECFPEGLRQLTGEKEILGININEMGREAAVIKVVARMFDLRFDVLWQRHERTKRRRHILMSFFVGMLVVVGFSIYAYLSEKSRIAERAVAESQLKTLYTRYLECEKLVDDSRYREAFSVSRDILLGEQSVHMPDSLHDMFEFVLRTSYNNLMSDTLRISDKFTAEFNEMDWGSMPVAFSEEDGLVYVGCNGFSAIDMSTGKRKLQSGFWPVDIKIRDNEIVAFDHYGVALYDKEKLTLKKNLKFRSSDGGLQEYVCSSADGETILTNDSDENIFNVWSLSLAKVMRSFGASSMYGGINHDGKIFATVDDDRLRLYDTGTGEEIRMAGGAYATELYFDRSGRWLLLYLQNYDAVRVLNFDTDEDYLIEDEGAELSLQGSFNFDGSLYANKFFVSDDGIYLAIRNRIYNMPEGVLFKILDGEDIVQGVKIYPEARKVIQVNYDRTMYVYTRAGEILFHRSPLVFDNLLDNDINNNVYDIEENDGLSFYKKGSRKKVGQIGNLSTDVYHVSVTPDGCFALVSALSRKTTLYNIKTGLPVDEYPFVSGDGTIGFGVVGEDGKFYFNSLSSTFEFEFIPLEKLLAIELPVD